MKDQIWTLIAMLSENGMKRVKGLKNIETLEDKKHEER
jgi:hypothetical protein